MDEKNFIDMSFDEIFPEQGFPANSDSSVYGSNPLTDDETAHSSYDPDCDSHKTDHWQPTAHSRSDDDFDSRYPSMTAPAAHNPGSSSPSAPSSGTYQPTPPQPTPSSFYGQTQTPGEYTDFDPSVYSQNNQNNNNQPTSLPKVRNISYVQPEVSANPNNTYRQMDPAARMQMAQQMETVSKDMKVLVLGIFSFITASFPVIGLILSIITLVLGSKSKREQKQKNLLPSQLVKIGTVLASIALVWSLFMIPFFFVPD
ncbi:MAG: DUF4190 domain-containing protein [Clostridia bacterium]|nr:DUF4190 domain-containing protein [Clostridia bacterium]